MRPAIEDCHAAGIRVVVITGDNKLTAEAICRSIGVFEEGQALEGSSLTGLAFAALPDTGAHPPDLGPDRPCSLAGLLRQGLRCGLVRVP